MKEERRRALTLMLTLFLASLVIVLVFSVPLRGNSRYFVVYSGQSTLVSGYISENTTWTLVGSPYIVVANVVVEPDVFLTIEPGVIVKFASGTNLVVDGGLIAQGNSTHEIKFTSNSTTPARGDWGTVNIRMYSTAANRFDHVQIEYTSTALTLAADCNITASFFEHNNEGILLEDAGNVYVGYVQVVDNTGTGIGGSINQRIEIENSKISMNGKGIEISGGSYNNLMKNSTVTRNADDGVRLSGVIENCNVSANGGDGIIANDALYNSVVSDNMGIGLRGWSTSVQNCTFTNNTIGLEFYNGLRNNNITNCDISENTEYGIKVLDDTVYVYDCNITNNGDGIYCDVGLHEGQAYVYDCNISNNRNGGVIGLGYMRICDSIIRNNSECGVRFTDTFGLLQLNDSVVEHNLYGVYGGVGTYGIYGSLYASGNTIKNNTIGVSTDRFTGSYTTIVNNSLVNIQTKIATLEYCNVYNSLVGLQTESGTIRYSNIYNNTEYNVKNMADNDINATYNWWGTTNETLIEEHIYDYYEDYNLGRVLYKPYLTEPIVIGTPVASFIYAPTEPVVNEIVTFNASSSTADGGTITSYEWDFGDGSSSVIEVDPITTYNYTTFGTYNVTLTVTDSKDLADTYWDTVRILIAPVANFTYSPTMPIINQTVTFNASASYDPDGSIVNYTWDFGDYNITTTLSPIIAHKYAEADTYTVTLNVTDNQGLWNTQTEAVQVIPEFPTATIPLMLMFITLAVAILTKKHLMA